ncbi:unnamed protein product [Alopecurus aequalis]
MQYNGPTFHRPPTVAEMEYPAGVVVETTLRVWAMSRWRSLTALTNWFLHAGFAHLPPGTPLMFQVEEVRRNENSPVIALLAHFTNPFDAYHLLGQVYWCGCEFIAFTTYNIYTNFDCIFPETNQMHTLPYNLGDSE